MTAMEHDVRPVVVIGAGPVGLAAALAMDRRGVQAEVIEARAAPESSDDPRVLALSHGTKLILESLGAWVYVTGAEAIRCVHVSQRGGLGRTMLTAEEAGLPALGYVVGYGRLMAALSRRAAERGIPLVAGARVVALEEKETHVALDVDRDGLMERIDAQVVVQADGAAPWLEQAQPLRRDYGQWALVADVRCERAGAGIAYERFTPEGPIALLPRGDRYALVWTVPADHAQALLALPSDAFAQRLGESFGPRVGRFTLAGPVSGFALALRFARNVAGARVVLIGNAAQTLHPVAAQGFNLGVRDAFELARALAGGAETRHALAAYRRSRRLDRSAGMMLTDLLVRVFGVELPGAGAARGLALAALDALPPLKRFLTRRMIFGPRG